MSSRKDEREQARAERQAREAALAAAATRRKRLGQLGAALGLAAIVVVVLVIVSSGGSKDSGGKADAITGAADVASLIDGIPQRNDALGDPKAPVTMVEFADPQCPFCGQFSRDLLPEIIKRYVRPGKLRIELRLLTFLGPDSQTAAETAAAAGRQNKLWQFIDLFYRNQGEENSGYVTDAFLRAIGKGVTGLDVARAFKDRGGDKARALLADAATDAQRNAIDSTPSFLLGKTGGTLKKLELTALSVDAFAGPIDKLAGG